MINRFSLKYGFLSNFYYSPMMIDDLVWETVEHYFQGMKTLIKLDREAIRVSGSPGNAKKLGRRVILRPDWEKVKYEVMYTGVKSKFQQNEEVHSLLCKTGNTFLEEGNTWHDNVWGNCSCPRCEKIEGKNALGKTIMQIRSELC